jgi:hypothetical protein
LVSYIKVGDSLVAQRNLPEALTLYRDSLAIAERLAKSDPGNAGWQRDLSMSHRALAVALQQYEHEQEARDHLAAGRAISAQLVQQYPAWAECKRDLAWFDKQIAMLGP